MSLTNLEEMQRQSRIRRIAELESALREIELNTRTGDLKTLKLHWIAMTALNAASEGER